jgi:DNA-directed RNA polymerase specialized sigma24 family protein
MDRSHEEAAAVLGCPVGTLKSYVFRAKKKLAAQLPGWENTR